MNAFLATVRNLGELLEPWRDVLVRGHVVQDRLMQPNELRRDGLPLARVEAVQVYGLAAAAAGQHELGRRV